MSVAMWPRGKPPAPEMRHPAPGANRLTCRPLATAPRVEVCPCRRREAAHRRTGSGESRLRQPEQLVRFGGGREQAVVFRPQPGALKLKIAYPRTQEGDLVEQAPVRRAPHVAQKGLRHIFSFECVVAG